MASIVNWLNLHTVQQLWRLVHEWVCCYDWSRSIIDRSGNRNGIWHLDSLGAVKYSPSPSNFLKISSPVPSSTPRRHRCSPILSLIVSSFGLLPGPSTNGTTSALSAVRGFSSSSSPPFREQKKHEDEAREKQTERRREAMNAQEVLRSLVEQIKEKEGPHGLIILEARYGHLSSSTTTENSIKIIDVTAPLQALVKDSTLRISTTASKCNLIGFYDPCIGEEKSLFIKYSLRSQVYTILYNDADPIVLPNRGKNSSLLSTVDRRFFRRNSRSSSSIKPFLRRH